MRDAFQHDEPLTITSSTSEDVMILTGHGGEKRHAESAEEFPVAVEDIRLRTAKDSIGEWATLWCGYCGGTDEGTRGSCVHVPGLRDMPLDPAEPLL